MKPPLPPDEAERISALLHYEVLDTTPEQEFDDLTHLAAQICDTPISAITLIDQDRQWFKSRLGVEIPETPRDASFCAHTILGDDLLVVPDTTADERFADNPFVTADPHVRFYAGAPLVTPDGYTIGALCVIDTVPRQLDSTQQDALRRLARQTVALLEARPEAHEKGHSRRERQQAQQQRRTRVAESAQHNADDLAASEIRYRRLFETARDGILLLNADTRQITDANPFMVELLGYSQAEFVGKELFEIGLLQDAQSSVAAFEELQENGYIRYEHLPLETTEGKTRDVEFVSNSYDEGGHQVVQCNIRDITERKRNEEALQLAHDELEMRVERRTAQLAKANSEMQVAKEEAENANLAKNEFISRMSHELRTPLNAILGFGQILERHELTSRQKEGVGYILKSGYHLLSLINEVLDVARVEAGHIELILEPVSLVDVVAECCALMQPLADKRAIRLFDKVKAANLPDPDGPDTALPLSLYAVTDRQRLVQVLLNLLSNAIKYNRPAGTVTISCQPRPGERICLAVQDTGQGIAAADLPKLFTPFERLKSLNPAIEGTGLGLSLSKRLVAVLGGSLQVESVVGQGSTFTLELPGATMALENAVFETVASSTAMSQGPVERQYDILCIEDNLSNLRLIEMLLAERPDIELLSAMQGSLGFDLAREHHPDLILLDLDLPDISGLEVMARLKSHRVTKDIPIVIVSADATPSQIEMLVTSGADAYLTKPLNIDQFLSTLDQFLQGTAV